MGREKIYREWEWEIQRERHRLEQERIRIKRGFKVSNRLVEKAAMKLGLEAIKKMSYGEFEGWCQKHGL